MGKPAKTQWDFGELFSPQATRRVFSVTELTGRVKRALEKEVGQVWVSGEVTNLREQASGHIYFSLKDAAAQLQCVCFRADARATRHLIKDGQKVLLNGELTVYEARGQYQLIVREVEAQGIGALQMAFEKLKQKLNAEGLFAQERKRAIPEFSESIGVVTSPTGAALRDVLHVIQRRQPGLNIILAPCRVQGAEAPAEIAEAIKQLNEWAGEGNKLDLILVTRGGGSLEDLWAFNEEVVARAIHASNIPVISAVGHEIDFTISDFVADLRAATPSAAAEIITEGAIRGGDKLRELTEDLCRLAYEHVEAASEQRRQLLQRLERIHPRRILNEQYQRLDDARESLLRLVRQGVRWHAGQYQNQALRLARLRPSRSLAECRESMKKTREHLGRVIMDELHRRKERVERARLQLQLLSPMNVLQRGYSITRDAKTGRVIRDASETVNGQRISTYLHQGTVESVVDDKTKS